MGSKLAPGPRVPRRDQQIDLASDLEQRIGRTHANVRLGIERDHDAQIFGQGTNFFHIENWYSGHSLLRKALKATGLFWVGRRNAARVVVRENVVVSSKIPRDFEGFRILHISDLHTELSSEAMSHAALMLRRLSFDVCVITGDFRALTYGPYEKAIRDTEAFCRDIKQPIYAVLGNHDSILMVPELERFGMSVLLNEALSLQSDTSDDHIMLAGVDDAHYFRAENLEKASADIEPDVFSVLLSHTPEIYRRAAHCGFDLMLSGHTHGGQICLPGGFAMKLNAVIPRHLGAGKWTFNDMQGYTSTGLGTSIVPVRFSCPPELVVHTLKSA
ncbi:MAG: metallophosphoesterase [Hyphomicrobiaceae bacterium]